MHILVCDDDREITQAISIYLANEGYLTIPASNGKEALEILAQREDIQLIIIDIMMPMMDGMMATLQIREICNIPIIMLSAKNEDTDKIMGLNFGADDYITKPFNPLELIARVKSQLRRYTSLGSKPTPQQGVYCHGGLSLNDNTKEVMVEGDLVKMTPLEYRILHLLIRHPGRVFSINEIYERVWGESAFQAENTVAVHIRHIREKIEWNPKEPKYLKVVWGVGYKIEKDPSLFACKDH